MEFINTIQEWERLQPVGTPCFRKQKSHWGTHTNRSQASPYQTKKPIVCFHCGKGGHMTKESRTKLAAEKSATPAVTETTKLPPSLPNRSNKKEVTCFICQVKGHKSPQCPDRPNRISKINIPSDKLVCLKENELFGKVVKYGMAITSDTVADISVVHEECVHPDQFTGQMAEIDSFNTARYTGKLCVSDNYHSRS